MFKTVLLTLILTRGSSPAMTTMGGFFTVDDCESFGRQWIAQMEEDPRYYAEYKCLVME